MSILSSAVRRTLARFGYELRPSDPAAPPPLAVFLRALEARAPRPLNAVVLDNDASIQAELFRSLTPERVAFASPDFTSPPGTPTSSQLLAPAGRFIAVADLGRFSPEKLLVEFPWLHRAEAWVLRAPLGAFWSGELDLTVIKADLARVGLELSDILQVAPRSFLQTPAGNVILICTAGSLAASHRVAEALAFLSAPITHRRDFEFLAGRGSFGFAAGIYNPGSVFVNGATHLLVRAENAPWAVQKSSEIRFFAASAPLLLRLDEVRRITSAVPLALAGAPDPAGHRAEDFRLFQFRGEIFSNHALISLPEGSAGSDRPLDVSQLQTRVGISRLDPVSPAFTWCGSPTIDRPLDRTEKNWAMFADVDRLLLIYSFAPYVVLTAEKWPELSFAPVLETEIAMPVGDPALAFRNSVNPVPYDDDHWLHIVHQVYPGKQYVFWAILIDRRSLRPVRASARPLARAWHGCAASIIYVCSVIADPAGIRLFAGLDDSSTAVAAIPRARLDAEWIAFPSTPP